MATSSKIPLPPMEGRKGRLRPSLSSAGSRLYAANGVELLTWTGIPSLTHLGITRAPELPFLLYPPLSPHSSLLSFHPPSPRGFPFPLAFNDTTLINSVNGSSTLQARLSQAPFSSSLPPRLLPCLSSRGRGGSSWPFRHSVKGARASSSQLLLSVSPT